MIRPPTLERQYHEVGGAGGGGKPPSRFSATRTAAPLNAAAPLGDLFARFVADTIVGLAQSCCVSRPASPDELTPP